MILRIIAVPFVLAAIILCGGILSLQLAFGAAFDAVAGCTQWHGRA